MYGSVEVGDGKSPDALESIPAFSVAFSCFMRAITAAESIHVDVPAIDGGAAPVVCIHARVVYSPLLDSGL